MDNDKHRHDAVMEHKECDVRDLRTQQGTHFQTVCEIHDSILWERDAADLEDATLPEDPS